MKKGKGSKKKDKFYNKKIILYVVLFALLILGGSLIIFKQTPIGPDDNKNNIFVRNESIKNETYIQSEDYLNNSADFLEDEINLSENKSGSGSGGGSKDNSVVDSHPEYTFVSSDSDEFLVGENTTDTFNLWLIGTCKDANQPTGKEDYCDGTTLKEYVLENGSCVLKSFDCLALEEYYNYTKTANCSGGKCVVTNKATVIQNATDSDNGLNFYSVGTCVDYQNNTYGDFCDSGLNFLVEYMIDPENITKCKEVETYCPHGVCDSGRCVVYDFDARSSSPYENASYCSDQSGEYYDVCEDNYFIKEQVVFGYYCYHEIIDCREILGSLGRCSNGKCIVGRG